MGGLTDIPTELTDDDKALFQILDAELNSRILFALLHGIYTGILAATLWNIFINKRWPIRRVMVVVIILLHALITINFAAEWSFVHSAFVKNGKSFQTVSLKLQHVAQAAFLAQGIAASMSTIITDLYMIWCCWIVWGRRWLIVLLPIITLIFGTASKIIEVYQDVFRGYSELVSVLYISSILTTTLWCTLLIIYRILPVAGVRHGAEGRMRVYHRFVEVLVESSALYSIALVLDLAFAKACGDFVVYSSYYLDVIAGIAKGIAPTLLVGRFAAGRRARPDDSWQESVIGSASIRSCSQEHSGASFREDDRASPMLDGDLEAQRESSVREPSLSLRSVFVAADYHAHANTEVSPETSPHPRSRSLLNDRSSLYEDVSHGSTVVDGATALRR